LFNEVQDFELPIGVNVNISQPGFYNEISDLTPATIPQGVSVNSYLLHLDGVGQNLVLLQGSVTFDQDILGLIVLHNELLASQDILGAPGTFYSLIDAGQIDFGGMANLPDNIFLTSDFKTIDVDLGVAPSYDVIRVVTVGSPPIKFNTPLGDYSTLERNPDGSFTRTFKNGTEIDFDSDGFQTSVIDRNGNTTTYSYDGNDNLTTITDPVGMVTTLITS